MKRFLLFISLLFTISVKAQMNLDLNTWIDKEPDGWLTWNAFAMNGLTGFTTIEDTVTPFEGLAAAKLVVDTCPLCPFISPDFNDTLSGILAQSFPVTGKPAGLDFWYKGHSGPGDEYIVAFELTHYDFGMDSTILDGIGFFHSNTNVTNWTKQSITVNYITTSQPDSATIIAAASGSFFPQFGGSISPSVQSYLYVDAFAINGFVSVPEADAAKTVVYPNPTQDVVKFTSPDATVTFVKLFDQSGRMVYSNEFNSNTATINTVSLANGVYTYRLENAKEEVLDNGKLVVCH